MAQVLVAQTQAAGGNPVSPGSGGESPALLGGDKISRSQAKKIFKDEVDVLVQGVKSIQTFADALSQMKKGVPMQIGFTDANGQQRQYQIGRNEYRELVTQITKRMQKLPGLAFTLNKTRRRTGPNSGFLAPAQFNQDIVNFFSQSTLGPQVTGELVLKTDKAMNKRSVPESTSLVEQQGSRLNNSLFFTQQQINGQRNPLYGIIAPGTLTPLFALHANYAQNPDGSRRGLQALNRDPRTGQLILNAQTGQPEIDATRLTASNEMRQALGNVMAQTIQNDARVIAENNPELAQEAANKAQQLIQAIQNPNLFVDPVVGLGTAGETEMFNPNYFLYAHFSKLISNGKIAAGQPGSLTPENLAQKRPEIAQVYNPLLQQALGSWQARANQATTPEARELAQIRVQLLQQALAAVPEQGVLTYQQDDVAKARALKNQVQGAVNRRRNADKKRQQAAQQAGAALPGQVGGAIGGFPMVTGLPGGIGGQSNNYGGSSSGRRRSGNQ